MEITGSTMVVNNPHKVIHIITGLDVGGAEQMLKRLLLSDPESKAHVLIISLTGIGTIGKHLEASGYQVHGLEFRRLASLATNFFALMKLIRANKPATVQTWMYHADFFGGLAARMAGCHNVIWGIRNTFVPLGSKQTYVLMRLCAMLSYVVPKKIICVAETAKNKHIAYGYQSKKMQVIPNGFDFASFDGDKIDKKRIRKELGLDDAAFVIGCVGRFHPDKGQDIFVMAVALLEKIHDKHIHFLLIGRDCDKKNEELTNRIDSFGLNSSFILLGERHDIPECLAAMDVFCMPSRTEGFPNGLGEAMAMGLACVATHVGDTKLLTGDAAIIVPADDAMALAAGLTKVICMPEIERKALGQQAAARVREQFSIDNARERFYTVYQELTE
ncbi:MAG: glycosyltransferase [Legionella sp.]|uniref:glycosyltransferase family 4 protein n=1 Tax=Legionella sp. TaxID=459 RepID=UPI0039E31A88